MNIGLFDGRHDLPVDMYVFQADETDLYGYHQELYNEAVQRGRNWSGGEPIKFFFTGLTLAAMGFVDGLRMKESPPLVKLMSYDRDLGEYLEVELVAATANPLDLWYS